MKLFGNRSSIHEGDFGSCCKDLGEAMRTPSQSMFRVEDNGVLYFTVGFVDTEEGVVGSTRLSSIVRFADLSFSPVKTSRESHIRVERRRSNQAMQLTASKLAMYASSVCRRERTLRAMHRGLAAADLVSR